MLIEFSVSNCRSFASEQSLKLVASKLKDSHNDRILKVDPPHNLEVLNSAIILGKNGSGKSTLVDAMGFVRHFVRTSSLESQEGEELPFAPNLLESGYRDKDMQFRTIFSMKEKIYQFEFSFNKDRITSESLSVADRTVRFRKIYSRLFDRKQNEEHYSFSEDLKGEKSTWRSSTRKNALFISTSVQLNSESLREPYEWLTKFLRTSEASPKSYSSFSARQCQQADYKRRILGFLKKLDIDVDDIRIDEEEIDEDFLATTFTSEFIQKTFRKDEKKKNYKVKFVHKDSDGLPIEFDLSEESTGTNVLFNLAGPLFDTLENGYCLVIDEINTNLHPLILQTLVDVFSDPSLNTRRAQLLFTSHDTSLLRDSYFRRDQVWFVEKNRHGGSALVPLSDFSPRKGEALEKGYLTGRYGGVPAISPIIEENLSEDFVDEK